MFDKYNCKILKKLGQQVLLSDKTTTTAIVELPASSSKLDQKDISYTEAAIIVSSSDAERMDCNTRFLIEEKEYLPAAFIPDGTGLTRIVMNESIISTGYKPYGY